MFEAADKGFGNRPIYRALTQNIMGTAYMLLYQHDNAETCLKKSLVFAEMADYSKAKLKALNNYAVIHRIKGEYDSAIDKLREIADMSDSDESALFMYYLNMGKTYMAAGLIDSAAVYYNHLEDILPDSHTKKRNFGICLQRTFPFCRKAG